MKHRANCIERKENENIPNAQRERCIGPYQPQLPSISAYIRKFKGKKKQEKSEKGKEKKKRSSENVTGER